MQLNRQPQAGFTLLELMLVAALVAALAVAGLAVYQEQYRSFRIDKTALQMQQWLQAGMAFYVDCGNWPDDTVDPQIMQEMEGTIPLTATSCKKYAGQIKAYMPPGSDSNGPWGNSYQIQQAQITNGQSGQQVLATYFQVSTNLGPNNSNIQIIGQNIAGHLPNAQYTVVSTPTPATGEVVAQVPVPGEASNNSDRGFILNMQMVTSGTASNVTYPTANSCPQGMTPVIGYAAANLGTMGSVIGSRLGIHSAVFTPITTGTGVITPSLIDQYTDHSTDTSDNMTLLITACIPNATTNNVANNVNVAAVTPGARY